MCFNGIGFIRANAYFAFRAIIFSRYFTASNFNISAAGIFGSGYNNANRNSANSNAQRICFGNTVICCQNSYIISFQFNTININFAAAFSINFAYRRICTYNTCAALIYIKVSFAGNISANINFIRIKAAAGNIYADIAIYVKDTYTCVNSRRACCTAAKCHIDVAAFGCICFYSAACVNITASNINSNCRTCTAASCINRRSNFCFANTSGCKSASCS